MHHRTKVGRLNCLRGFKTTIYSIVNTFIKRDGPPRFSTSSIFINYQLNLQYLGHKLNYFWFWLRFRQAIEILSWKQILLPGFWYLGDSNMLYLQYQLYCRIRIYIIFCDTVTLKACIPKFSKWVLTPLGSWVTRGVWYPGKTDSPGPGFATRSGGVGN